MSFRIGQGIDVHGYDDSRPLILGGVRIADRGGLAGHSDADAVLHAITDALLGASAAGDIGSYFPSDDPRWKDASSDQFVREALGITRGKGFQIGNLDVTIIAQKPRLAPWRDQIRKSVAALIEVDSELVSIKATTTDHLGFIGREEGIAALAIVLLRPKAESPENS
ncbi:MAG TPA: 2-C-methyl-D-erythritol 2,4-cyclodiphosphate synthase [Thermoanaerobaculia bacterium]|nr:2-C-methyl-D-erythritol 2,4-cyclodiphosphate synthase [Thermoanaerobaculia bacterium]